MTSDYMLSSNCQVEFRYYSTTGLLTNNSHNYVCKSHCKGFIVHNIDHQHVLWLYPFSFLLLSVKLLLKHWKHTKQYQCIQKTNGKQDWGVAGTSLIHLPLWCGVWVMWSLPIRLFNMQVLTHSREVEPQLTSSASSWSKFSFSFFVSSKATNEAPLVDFLLYREGWEMALINGLFSSHGSSESSLSHSLTFWKVCSKDRNHRENQRGKQYQRLFWLLSDSKIPFRFQSN